MADSNYIYSKEYLIKKFIKLDFPNDKISKEILLHQDILFNEYSEYPKVKSNSSEISSEFYYTASSQYNQFNRQYKNFNNNKQNNHNYHSKYNREWRKADEPQGIPEEHIQHFEKRHQHHEQYDMDREGYFDRLEKYNEKPSENPTENPTEKHIENPNEANTTPHTYGDEPGKNQCKSSKSLKLNTKGIQIKSNTEAITPGKIPNAATNKGKTTSNKTTPGKTPKRITTPGKTPKQINTPVKTPKRIIDEEELMKQYFKDDVKRVVSLNTYEKSNDNIIQMKPEEKEVKEVEKVKEEEFDISVLKRIIHKLNVHEHDYLYYILHPKVNSSYGPLSTGDLEELLKSNNLNNHSKVRFIDVYGVKGIAPFTFFTLKSMERPEFLDEIEPSSLISQTHILKHEEVVELHEKISPHYREFSFNNISIPTVKEKKETKGLKEEVTEIKQDCIKAHILKHEEVVEMHEKIPHYREFSFNNIPIPTVLEMKESKELKEEVNEIKQDCTKAKPNEVIISAKKIDFDKASQGFGENKFNFNSVKIESLEGKVIHEEEKEGIQVEGKESEVDHKYKKNTYVEEMKFKGDLHLQNQNQNYNNQNQNYNNYNNQNKGNKGNKGKKKKKKGVDIDIKLGIIHFNDLGFETISQEEKDYLPMYHTGK